ncbi:MAG: hypothetical protein JXB48_21870 [Candidatus Latescibacteria bacterium]|nr:hypothetical protein [Candidatus Latescibacterota bacterium]
METYHNMKQLLRIVIGWENQLTNFYNRAEKALESEKSKEIVALLKQNHVNNMQYVEEIRVENYGKDEWIQYTPDCNIRNLIPTDKIKCESKPIEIIKCILNYELKIEAFYSSVADLILSREMKELFESLAAYKGRQAIEIKRLIDSIEYI